MFLSVLDHHSSIFGSFSPTCNWSTIVIPLDGPSSTIFTLCLDTLFTTSSSKATAIATGSGNPRPGSPNQFWLESSACLLQSIAKSPFSVLKLYTCSISSSVRFASPLQSSHPTIVISGCCDWKTTSAASGSHQMLYSAAGVTFPTVLEAPPIITIFFNIKNESGYFEIKFAILVRGPSVTSVISFGFSSIKFFSTSIKSSDDSVCFGSG